jgi:peptidoglycan-binding lysM
MNLTKRITGVIALVVILLLLAGVPVLLWWLGQPFIPTSVPDLGQALGVLFRRDDGSVVVLLIYLVAWIAWLYLSIALLVEGWAAIRRIPAPQLPGFRLPQGIAKRLVAAALLAFVATPAIANANPVPPPAVATQPAVTTTTTLPATITDDTPPAPNVVKHTVGPGDSLWALAEHYLGDPNRYPEIFDANKGIIQANGTRLTNPDVIVDGTVLMIPTAPEAPAPEPAAPEAPAPEPSTSTPTSSPAPDPSNTPTPNTPEASEVSDSGLESHAPVIDADQEEQADHMPMVTTFGAGSLLAGGVVLLIANRRSAQRRTRRRGAELAMPTGQTAAVEHELRVVGDVLAIEEVDQALRALARHCRTSGQELPAIRVARMTATTFELYLHQPCQLPAPWEGLSDQTLWSLPVGAAIPPPEQQEPEEQLPAPYPSLVTIGHDIEGAHILLDLEHIGELAITGDIETAEEILAALAIELATSTWADDITITLVGAFPEMEDTLQTGRIRYLPTAGRLFEELAARAAADRETLRLENTTDPHQARIKITAPSTWYPEVVLLSQPLTQRQEKQLNQLLNQLPRVAIAAVSLGERPSDWTLIHEHGNHIIQPLDLTITPQRVPTAQYKRLLEIADITTHGQAVSNQYTPADVTDLINQATKITQEATHTAKPDNTTTTPAPEEPTIPQEDPPTAVVAARALDEEELPPTLPAIEDDTVTDTEADDAAAAPETGPRPDQPYLQLLGPIQLLNTPGTAETKRQKRMIEYLAYLMLTPTVSIDSIDEAIWPNRRTQDNTATRNSVTSRLRKWIGTTTSQTPRLEMNTYKVNDVGCDWTDFQNLTNQPLARIPTPNLTAAVDLVHGPVLKGAGIRYWAWAEPLRQEMITRITDVCYELATRQLVADNYTACETTLARALAVEPGDEQLWRMRILAAHARHNPAAVDEAINRLYAQLEALDTTPEDRTEEFLTELRKGTALTTLMEMI